jgi:hypothetical protein
VGSKVLVGDFSLKLSRVGLRPHFMATLAAAAVVGFVVGALWKS